LTTKPTQAHLARMQYEPEDADNDEREDVPIYPGLLPLPPPTAEEQVSEWRGMP
jgi:hypothetical protein